MGDYSFFGSAFRWQPSEIDGMTWMDRKRVRQGYEDYMKEQKK